MEKLKPYRGTTKPRALRQPSATRKGKTMTITIVLDPQTLLIIIALIATIIKRR